MKSCFAITLVIVVFLLFANCNKRNSSGPNWEEIKANAKPYVALQDEFGTPRKLSIAVEGWEDGIYVTRDGLNLYCTYVPVDLFSLELSGDGDITNFSAYRRGPTFGMDLTTNPIGASEWLQSDILYTHRSSVDEPFPEWQLSNLARPVWSEGGVQIVMKDESTADIFAYTSDEDILIFRNSSLNPSGVGDPLPPPVNTPNYNEDNPHIERLDSLNLVLFFDSDRPGGEGKLDIWYSTSSDDGVTWSQPKPVTTVNDTLNQMQPHLFPDTSGTWYLYYATENPNTRRLEIWRARLSEAGNWDSWTDHELVIGPGNTFAVGEPTLTQEGDIYFVVIYDAGDQATETDRFDADPWFLPRRR